MVSALSLGLRSARLMNGRLETYVSGYLRTYPAPGKPRLIGADASHAGASAYRPGRGWLDLDPTNNLVPSSAHVTLAWGRDYSDVSPLHSPVSGGGGYTLKVGVDMEGEETPLTPSYEATDESDVLTLGEIRSRTEGGKPADTLMNVVALIATRFRTDVCSAYLLEPDRSNLVLAATLGGSLQSMNGRPLPAASPSRLPPSAIRAFERSARRSQASCRGWHHLRLLRTTLPAGYLARGVGVSLARS